MNTRDYMNKLVALLTGPQLEMYGRMYPGGPTPKQIPRAIDQLETTLKQLNHKMQILNTKNDELEAFKVNFGPKEQELQRKIGQLTEDLKSAEAEIRRLSSPVNVANADVQRKLDKLAALEAGGVDNWEWYGEAMSAIDDDE